MIVGKIKDIEMYKGLSKNLDTAIDSIKRGDYKNGTLGRNEIDGDKVFFNFQELESTKDFEEGKYNNSFLFGMEESIGYLKGTYVRDKDGVVGAMLLSEMSCYYKNKNISLIEVLEDLYNKYGWYSEITYPVKKEGIQGSEDIKNMMKNLREKDLKVLLNKKINIVRDYKLQVEKDYVNNSQSKLDLPISNVIQYILEDGTYITVRPSGTEPKIKYYIYTKGNSKQEADKKLDLVLNEFKEYMESLK